MKYHRDILIKIIIYVLIILALIPAFILLILQIPPIQKSLSRQISRVLTRSFNTTTLVRRVSYSMDNKLVIKGIYIEDYNLDTLLYVNKAKVKIWEVFSDKVNFSTISIDGLKLRIREDTNGYTNLLVFLENLPTNPQKQKKNKQKINLQIKQIDIRNFDISYQSPFDSLDIHKFNPKNFHIYPLNLTLQNVQIQDSSYEFTLYDFYFKDRHSGFEVKNMSTQVSFTNKGLKIKDFNITLDHSEIDIPILQVDYDSLAQLHDPQSLEFFMVIDTSTVINSRDLAYFNPQLVNDVFNFRINMTAYGSLGDITLMPLHLSFGKKTMLRANAHIIGLPDINHTYIDVNLDTLQFLLSDITSVRDARGQPLIPLPKQMYKLSSLKASGKITGLLNNFSAFVESNSNLGYLKINADVSRDTLQIIHTIITARDLDVGRILDNNKLGKISFSDTLNLYLNGKNFSGSTDLLVYQAFINSYNYQNISLSADFDNTGANAQLSITDSNLITSFRGVINKKDKLYHTRFYLNLQKAKLYPLHLDKEDPNASIKFALKGELSGSNINDFYGHINLTQPIVYIKNLEKIQINHFIFTSVLKQYISGLPFKEMFIQSDLVDASMIGVFELSSLAHYFQNVMGYYFPSLRKNQNIGSLYLADPRSIGANIIMQINLKDLTPITRIFAPQISFAPHTMIQSVYKAIDHAFMLKVTSDSIVLNKNVIKTPQININTDNDTLHFNFTSKQARIGVLNFQNLAIYTESKNDTIHLCWRWHNISDQKNFGFIEGITTIKKLNTDSSLQISANITHDSVYINGRHWQIKDFSTIANKKTIQINSYFFNPQEKQEIGIVGKISPNPRDKIFIRMQMFDISQLNPILKNIKLEGFLNSTTQISNIYKNPIINSDNVISHLKVNDVDLQMLTATSRFNSAKNILTFKVYTEKALGEIKPKDTVNERYVDIDGLYRLDDKSYKVDIDFEKFKLIAFYPYFRQIISAISRFSTIQGKIAIKGQGRDVRIKGDIGIVHGAFKLRPTNVTYSINKVMGIHFTKDHITIDTTTIISQGGTGKAKLWGTINRTPFNDYQYQIFMRPDTFMVLNLPNNGQQNYYGKAFVSGNANISGFGDNISLNADLKAEDNTDLTFLINSPKKISATADFIKFVTPDSLIKQNNPNTKKQKKSAVDINVNLEVTPQSRFTLVIDEQTGEKFQVRGSGILNIKMSPYGGFLLSGTLTVTDGIYNFTLENIVNKKFQIKPGSTIKWNGSPQDAQLDLTAVYKVNNANLYDLTLDDNYWEVRTPVNCLIHIKGKLTEPQISFDLDLPKADQRILSQIANLESAEKTKQVLSLLILGKFQPLPGLSFNPNQLAGNTSAADVLSSQLANLISNIDENLELGVNYKTGQQGLTPEQLEVALSYKLWNERISINTDVGIGSNTNPALSNNPNQFIGDVEVDVKLDKKGDLQLKAFNKTNRNEFYDKGPYTQGVGIMFKKDFSSLFPKKHKKKKKFRKYEKQK